MSEKVVTTKKRKSFDAWAWTEKLVFALWRDGFRTQGKIVDALKVIHRYKYISGIEMGRELIKIVAAEPIGRELTLPELQQWLKGWKVRYSNYQEAI